MRLPSTDNLRSVSPSKRWNGATAFALAAILLAAAAFRLLDLGSNPPALFRDEAEKGYTAWSLAKLGGYTSLDPRDGSRAFHRWPLFVQTWGALTSAVYQYAGAPIVSLLGLSKFTIRLPAALAGIATVWLCFALSATLSGQTRVGLLAAALLAVSPWHIVFSRWAQQGIFVPLFVSAGAWLFWRGAQTTGADLKRARILWPAAALLFGAAAYAYEPARLAVPLLVGAAAICAYPAVRKRPGLSVCCALVLLAVVIPLIVFQLTKGAERFGRVWLFNGRTPVGRSLWVFAANYLSHFSPRFLFLHGDTELRHSLPGFGQLLFVEAPFFVVGVVVALRHAQNRILKRGWFLLAWLAIAPIPAALTSEGIPHALRAITALPAPAIISAVGFFSALDWFERRVRRKASAVAALSATTVMAVVAVAAVCLVNVGLLAWTLFRVYPIASAPSWQFGLEQALQQVRERTPRGAPPPAIYLSSRIPWAPYLVLVYERIDPAALRDKGLGAILPDVQLPPVPPQSFYESATSGSWFILEPGELPPSPQSPGPISAVFFPSYSTETELPMPALFLYRKP